MRHKRPVISALLVAGLLGSQLLVAAEVISDQALNQKLKLAKKMVTQIHHQTQANKIDSGAWQAPYRQSIKKINQTQQAIYQGDNTAADKILTDIFALITDAKAKLSKQHPDPQELTAYYRRRNEALNSFKSSLQDTLNHTKDPTAQQALSKANALQQSADQLLNNDIHRAITELEQAYQLIVAQITRLRDNETAIVSLNFATPEDEYRYDLRRVKSFKLLLEMQLNKKTPDAATLKLISSHQNTAKEFESQARLLATQGKYKQALTKIAKTIKSQQRALRTAGLNIM